MAVEPLGSAAEGVATWPETATAVAVRLCPDGGLESTAPCGLADLQPVIVACQRPLDRGLPRDLRPSSADPQPEAPRALGALTLELV